MLTLCKTGEMSKTNIGRSDGTMVELVRPASERSEAELRFGQETLLQNFFSN